ncbi:uncharacterized protein FOMMEDRAFT_152951 [Fomitiporia mediterranea MF3/22]|uniref:uncharacterized protein n=1 Tax=Fomitiporia mediterranea (strain MF3/22) TaxID=694068 RepID=UPI00044096DE|nr:uncharacterized protein FOMMEDRAFT_152951 [Fomitiporia mediterranea MF3/22]EJD05623.1 hypothetical protein FOMMEDRAFT_152951 [Fomitiporia mediterranea MF3/22]
MLTHHRLLAISLISASSVSAVCPDFQIGVIKTSGDVISKIVDNNCNLLDQKPEKQGFEQNVCNGYSNETQVTCNGDPFNNNVHNLKTSDGTSWGHCINMGGASACNGRLLFCCSK